MGWGISGFIVIYIRLISFLAGWRDLFLMFVIAQHMELHVFSSTSSIFYLFS